MSSAGFIRAVFLCLGVALTTMGCSWCWPAHPKSEDVKGEQVSLKFLTYEQMQQDYGPAYVKVFDTVGRTQKTQATIEPSSKFLGAEELIAGGKIAYSKFREWMTKEAAKHEGAFAAKMGPFDDLWTAETVEGTERPRLKQTYAGFRVARTTLKSRAESKSPPAFETVCAMAPDLSPGHERGEMRIVPIYFKTTRPKAKVGYYRHEHWYDPRPLVAWAFDLSGRVNTNVKGEIGFPNQDPKDDSTIGRFEFDVVDYDIANPKELIDPLGAKNGDNVKAGTIRGVPVDPRKASGSPGGGGPQYSLQVMVTEKDCSRIQRWFVKGSDEMKENEDKVFTKIPEWAKKLHSKDSEE